MRKIKFRAKPINLSFKYDDGEQGNVEWVYGYYTQKTTYVEPFGLGECTVEHFINVNCIEQSSEFEWYVTDFCKQCDVEDDYHNVFDNDNVPVSSDTVCQFTGLKDCNGEEIYEGDIIKTSNNYVTPALEMVEVVTFRRGQFLLCTDKGLITEDLINACQFHKATVIGNIHDNPELLKEI
ncbi:MAG: hypothetical protein II937_09955 [Bacteroidales bacterium]|nr:hypothetical protein [Bacteroidales bacterium]